MLSVLDPVHGHVVGGFEGPTFGGGLVDGDAAYERRARGGRHRSQQRLQPRQHREMQQPQSRKSPKVSAAPRGSMGRSLEDIAEFTAGSASWRAEIELARQRAEVLRSSSQLVAADVAALERNQTAHRRLHAELITIFEAIFAEADSVFELHKQRLLDEAATLRQRTADLEDQLARLTEGPAETCDDTSVTFVRNYEQLMEHLPSILPRKHVPCHGEFGEEFQQAVKARLAFRSSGVLLRDFQQQQSSACRVFPCLLNMLGEIRSELLLTAAPSPDETPPIPKTGGIGGGAVRRLDSAGVCLTDLALVRATQALFYKPKFGVKHQRGWFGWSALPETVIYGVCPGDSGSQLLVLSRTGQYLTGMRIGFDACPSASVQASRFDALHFSARAQLLFLSDPPNNRVLLTDLCGVCRVQLSGLNQPRGAHHDDLNERLFVINGGTGTLEVFGCPLYPQQQQQQQLPRLGKCVQHPGLTRISAVATSLRSLYIFDCQLARVFVFANQLGFPFLRAADLLPSPRPGPCAPPLFVYLSGGASAADGSEPELRTAELPVCGAEGDPLSGRPLFCANEAGCAFQPEERMLYMRQPGLTCVLAVRLS